MQRQFHHRGGASFTNGRQGEKNGKQMCQNIGDEVYLFYIFIIYIVDIGKIIIKECENDRMNDQEGSTRGVNKGNRGEPRTPKTGGVDT